MAILFSNATVLPMTAAGNAPRTFAGWVGVDGNRIALVTESETAAAEFRAAHPGLREFDCRGKLVMPGLVNTHCHAAMTLQRNNIPREVISQMLGHADLETTNIYLDSFDNGVINEAAKVL